MHQPRAIPVALALPLCLLAELFPIKSYSTADGLAADSMNEIVTILAASFGFARQKGYPGSTVTASSTSACRRDFRTAR